MLYTHILFVDSPVYTTVDQKLSVDDKNGLPNNDIKHLNAQSLSSKVQDIISIGSRYGI